MVLRRWLTVSHCSTVKNKDMHTLEEIVNGLTVKQSLPPPPPPPPPHPSPSTPETTGSSVGVQRWPPVFRVVTSVTCLTVGRQTSLLLAEQSHSWGRDWHTDLTGVARQWDSGTDHWRHQDGAGHKRASLVFKVRDTKALFSPLPVLSDSGS